jgi:transketolase
MDVKVTSEDFDRIKQYKIAILTAAYESGEGHVPSAFSILDILYCLYKPFLNTGVVNFEDLDFKFILSKGHAALGLYALLSEIDASAKNWVSEFSSYQSRFGGHPDRNKLAGVTASTGSLGHGLPMAVGIALANKASKVSKKTIVLVGDGELNEGSNWESLMVASHHKLQELLIITDFNHSTDRAVDLGDLESKMKSFGLETISIDGHNHSEIKFALEMNGNGRPRCVIAKTIKGYGLKEMENNPAWHHASPNSQKLTEFIRELTL